MKVFTACLSLLWCFSTTVFAATLENGVPLLNLTGANGSSLSFTIQVPANSQQLTISINGGTGDADVYVRFGATPSTSIFDCRPFLNGNNETCQFSTTQVGTYYILVRGYSAFTGVKLQASYNSGNTGGDGATWDGFADYYANAIGLQGSALRSELNRAAAKNHSRMTYAQVWDALKYTDEDPANSNNVLLFYTGRSQAKTFNASGNNNPDAWNREHVWPKSHGFPNSGNWGYTDIHHLRPADASVNGTRGNKDLDNGGAQVGEAPGNFTDSNSFEPRNMVKGYVARMMFYMDIRYNGNDNTGTADLALVNYTGTSGANLGKICTLLLWHNQDPVSSAEIARHSRIVGAQGNRNPFVDYPQWANDIWGAACN